jgi:DNA primase
LSDFLIDELSSQVDMQTVDGRARLAELARPLLAKIPAGVYRELLVGSLAGVVGLTPPKLEQILSLGGDATTAGQIPGRGPGKRPARRGGPERPSVVRRAITLLLHQPAAAGQLDVDRLAGVRRPGVDLLRELIEMAQAEPNISTAGLLERWRHHEQGRHLGKLAAVEVPDEEEFDPAVELTACLDQLALMGRRERIEVLIEKQRLDSLTEDEKSELRRLSRTQ